MNRYERCCACGWNRQPAESAYPCHEQASAADLRQADGVLPDPDTGECRDSRDSAGHRRKECGDFLRLLGNGRDFGLKHLNYTYQEGEGGIAEALGLAEYFAGDEPICVVLGDNIIENNICQAVDNFKKQKDGAKILLKEVTDAQRFGVAEIRGNASSVIEEKPKTPKSNYAVIGIYLYDATVFQKIRRLKPSGRGELEITDVNNFYIEEGKLTYEILEGWWTDAGTFESLLRANNLVAETGANKMPESAGRSFADRKPRDENFRHRRRGIHRLEFHSSVLSLGQGYRSSIMTN